MKKILVLGGVGAMASETTIDLVNTGDFEQIMVADINLERAEAGLYQRLLSTAGNGSGQDAL